MQKEREPDPRAKDWPGPVVYIDYRDWGGVALSDAIIVYDVDKIVVERNGELLIVERG